MAVKAPVNWRDSAEHRRKLAEAANASLDGQGFNAGLITLTASSTTTVVTDLRAGVDSVITFMPKTANAASALSGLYVSSRGKGTFTITHASTATTDRDFEYALHGTGRTSV